jgi:hypothetical protein
LNHADARTNAAGADFLAGHHPGDRFASLVKMPSGG